MDRKALSRQESEENGGLAIQENRMQCRKERSPGPGRVFVQEIDVRRNLERKVSVDR